MSKLKIVRKDESLDEFEQTWDKRASCAREKFPLKELSKLPRMEGMTPDTAKNLRWNSFKWIFKKDVDYKIIKGFLKHPFRYSWTLLCSLLKKRPYLREGDLFLYGIKNIQEFTGLLESQKTLFVVGFSYCHKPFECPSGRFTDACINDPENLVCQQCFIGKCMNMLPKENVVPLLIPTIHYIGGKILDLMQLHPNRQIVFLITACEMSLNMFADLGNMAKIKGIGVRLDGRICNTMKAFALSEEGIKPGLTVVLDETKRQFLEFIRHRRQFSI